MSFGFASHVGGLAQSVECVVSNDEAPGSKPGFSTLFVKSISAAVPKSSSSGNRTPGVCVTGRNVTNYTNEEEKGTTGIEPVTAGSAIPCSTAELSTHLRLGAKGPGRSGSIPARALLTLHRHAPFAKK